MSGSRLAIAPVDEAGTGFLSSSDPRKAWPGSPHSSHQRDVPAAVETGRQTVLVVDDENLIADSVAEILNRNGYDAVAKYDGKGAIASIEAQCPDIFLSDVVMPDLDGVQLAKTVRGFCPRTRIVLFSGNAATSRLLEIASLDGYSFELLAKPIHPVELLKTLRP